MVRISVLYSGIVYPFWSCIFSFRVNIGSLLTRNRTFVIKYYYSKVTVAYQDQESTLFCTRLFIGRGSNILYKNEYTVWSHILLNYVGNHTGGVKMHFYKCCLPDMCKLLQIRSYRREKIPSRIILLANT